MWTKNAKLKKKLKGEYTNVVGMYDTMPTLLNMLGIEYKYTLGHDIFNIKEDDYVVFPNGNFLTNKVYYNNSTGDYKELNGNKALAEKELDVGNAIIMYDLKNEKNNTNKGE